MHGFCRKSEQNTTIYCWKEYCISLYVSKEKFTNQSSLTESILYIKLKDANIQTTLPLVPIKKKRPKSKTQKTPNPAANKTNPKN